MKPLSLRLALLACLFFLPGCLTWFFPYFPETRGTWTGKISGELIARDVPDHRTAPALVMTIADGPPIKIHKNGAWSHAYTRNSRGIRLVLVDREDRMIRADNLIGQTVRVRGVVSLTEYPLDSVTGESMARFESDTNTIPVITGTRLWIIKTSTNQIQLPAP